MAAAGKGEDIGDVHHMLAEAVLRRHAVWQVRGIAGAPRQGGEVDGAIAATHDEASRAIVELVDRGLQQMRRQPPRRRQRRLHRLDQCRAAHMHRARPAMARPAADGARVGLHVAEGLDRQAEMARCDLRESRLVPLPVRFGPHRDRH